MHTIRRLSDLTRGLTMTNVPDNPYLQSSFEHLTRQYRHAAMDEIRLLYHDMTSGEYHAQEWSGQSSVS